MINISPINFTNIDEVKNNIIFYKNIFINDGILIFRNANLSQEEHLELHEIFKNSLGWYNYRDYTYTQNYSNLLSDNTLIVDDGDKIMLGWHSEHPQLSNPIVATTWNMHKFNTDSENGKIFLVDMEKLFIRLPEKYKNFSKECSVYNPQKNKVNNIIGYHWISNNPIIRLSVAYEQLDTYCDLEAFEGFDPEEKHIKKYKEMMYWINSEITTNLDIRMVHKWKQGDLAIVDMHKMCYAITGGFNDGDIEYVSIWGYRNKKFSRMPLEMI